MNLDEDSFKNIKCPYCGNTEGPFVVTALCDIEVVKAEREFRIIDPPKLQHDNKVVCKCCGGKDILTFFRVYL